VNGFSPRWRVVFGEVDAARTAADVDFLTRVLPLPEFERVLDVPCGNGRHLRALGELGYRVTGVDNDPAVSPPVLGDLRELDSLPEDFDAVINMWQSFGYFDAVENERVLASLGRRLRPGGRLVLDLQNRDFFEARSPAVRELRPGIVECSTFLNGRRRCEIDYGDGSVDVHEWQLYAPEELEELGRRSGLAPAFRVASQDEPLMRLVLRRDP
jgi:SAM-dependent methyltransferase